MMNSWPIYCGCKATQTKSSEGVIDDCGKIIEDDGGIKATPRCLILGNFGRQSIGDDVYKLSFDSLLKDFVKEYSHPFDIERIPLKMVAVVCVGASVLTEWFLKRFEHIAQDFKGPVYAFSVCIVNDAVARHAIPRFDKISMRILRDVKIAASLIGVDNVFCTPDLASYVIKMKDSAGKHVGEARDSIAMRKRLGMCPGIFKNAVHHAALHVSIEELQARGYQVALVPFKRSDRSHCHRLSMALRNVHVVNIKDPMEMMEYFKSLDVVVSSHFPALLFGDMLCRPTIALACPGYMLEGLGSHVYCVQPMVNGHLELTFDTSELLATVAAAVDAPVRKPPSHTFGSIGNIDLKRFEVITEYLSNQYLKKSKP